MYSVCMWGYFPTDDDKIEKNKFEHNIAQYWTIQPLGSCDFKTEFLKNPPTEYFCFYLFGKLMTSTFNNMWSKTQAMISVFDPIVGRGAW